MTITSLEQLNELSEKELLEVTDIYFTRLGLTEIPEKVFKCKNLIHLRLVRNKLETLPAEISELKNLTELDLSENNLGSLPTEISNLPNLTDLYLWENNLESLPVEISNLPNLKKFHCELIETSNNKNIFNSLIGNRDNKRCFVVLDNGNVAAGCFIEAQKHKGLTATIKDFYIAVEKKYKSMEAYCPEFAVAYPREKYL